MLRATTTGHRKVMKNQPTTLLNRSDELDSLQKLLDASRLREKRLIIKLEELGGVGKWKADDLEEGIGKWKDEDDNGCPIEPSLTFYSSLFDRGIWLVGLLIVQSLSSFILSANERLLQTHPSIIYFLTMLGEHVITGILL